MPLNFDVAGPGGEAKDVGMGSLLKVLADKGEQVMNVAPDGMSIQVMGMHGPLNVPTDQAWQKLGFKVNNATPSDADYSGVTFGNRAAIESMPDEAMKKQYLEAELKKQGMQNPQVMGSGRDYFVFDPQTNKYKALTNNPDWDPSDVAEALVAAPRVVGALGGGVAGGAVGALGGPVTSVVAGMGGAAGGGAAGTGLSRAIVKQLNPDAAKIMDANQGSMNRDMAKNAAFDAVGYGLPVAAGKVAGAVLGKGAEAAAQTGIGSTIARGAGFAAENAGKLINKGSQLLDSPVGSDLAAASAPFTGDIMGTGMIAQLPGQAVRGAARGMGWLGERESLKGLAPEIAAKLRNTSAALQQPLNTPSIMQNEIGKGVENFANKLKYNPGPAAADGGSETVMGNAGNMLKRKMLYPDYKLGKQYGLNAEEALQAAKQGRPNAERVAGAMRSAGRGLDTIENVGKNLETVGKLPIKAAAKAGRLGGAMMSKGGTALKAAGTIGQPLENRILSTMGAEELDDYLNPKRPWQKPPNQSTMDSVLATYDL